MLQLAQSLLSWHHDRNWGLPAKDSTKWQLTDCCPAALSLCRLGILTGVMVTVCALVAPCSSPTGIWGRGLLGVSCELHLAKHCLVLGCTGWASSQASWSLFLFTGGTLLITDWDLGRGLLAVSCEPHLLNT